MRVPPAETENVTQEKYDSYLTKLQNICTEQVGEEGGVKPVTETLKSALQNISVLPTPTWNRLNITNELITIVTSEGCTATEIFEKYFFWPFFIVDVDSHLSVIIANVKWNSFQF